MADIAAQIACGCAQPACNSVYRRIEGQLGVFRGPRKQVEALRNRLLRLKEGSPNDDEFCLQGILQFLQDPARNEDNLKRVNHRSADYKCLCYDVTDVLDKWNTAILMLEIRMAQASREVCCFRPLSFSFKRLRLHQEIVFHMNSLKKELQKFEEKPKIEFDEHLTGQLIESLKPETSSYGLPKGVYGRDEEKEILMSKLNLRRSPDQDGSCVDKTVAILGTAGVGKTALAQLVFNDDEVQKTFVPIWVSAPYKFDLNQILKFIIEQVNPAGPGNADALHTLLHSVVDSIAGKRLLLVLDDVRTVEPTEWGQLIAVLEKSDPWSRILVTTQDRIVVQKIGIHDDNTIHLQLLSKDDSWSIVNPLASKADWNCSGQLEQDIRDKFWSKCSGLPLVAHFLKNQLLCSKNSKQDWDRILGSEIGDDEKKLFITLAINSYGLTPLQRNCLAYLSVFPRNYLIANDDAVELWMSQGYFTERPEENGQRCFQDLANRCLFQDSTEDHNGDIIDCKMPRLVYEYAQLLRKPEEAHHFTLLLESSQAQIPSEIGKKKKLWTLFVVRPETSSTPSNPLSCDVVVKLKGLRTLRLGNCNIENLPENIHMLRQLRYLNLSGNPLTTLPEALCYLFNLQTLQLKGCAQLQRLPKKMQNLTQLLHLHTEGCYVLEALPKETGKLTRLRTLDMLVVPSPVFPRKRKALNFEDLNQLKDLQGRIHIFRCGNLVNENDLRQGANLIRRVSFLDLKLNFNGSPGIGDERAILDALQPHSDLMSLEITGCSGKFYPDWINSLNCLKRLVLCGCRNWKSLPPLGKLQSLELLHMGDLHGVENVGPEFLGIASGGSGTISFPNLKQLSFSCLANWQMWEWNTSSGEVNGSKIMPCLTSLQLSGCGNLRALPGFLGGMGKLLNLIIDGCTILRQRCQEDVGEDWGKISHIRNIKIDGVPIIRRSVVESQASTSGSSAILAPGSNAGPSTSTNSRNR